MWNYSIPNSQEERLYHNLTFRNSGFYGAVKMASQGSPDWNRIEEWLLNLERLRSSLEANGSMTPPSLP
jgi:hypothetical protein